MNKQHKYIIPTDKEEASINAMIAADPDDFESDFTNAFRSIATTPQGIVDDVMTQYHDRQKENNKQTTTISLPKNVIDFFKADGKDWKRGLSHALEEYVKEHKVG